MLCTQHASKRKYYFEAKFRFEVIDIFILVSSVFSFLPYYALVRLLFYFKILYTFFSLLVFNFRFAPREAKFRETL